MTEHKLPPSLLSSPIRVLVAGCGGTGSAVTGWLPYLHQAMVAFGHPGLQVTVADGERITAANCVRQPFSRSEIGLFKCVVLVNRIILFWGFDWHAFPESLCSRHSVKDFDLVLGCVDSRASRAVIHRVVTAKQSRVVYWLDIGNTETGGQYILGQPLNPATRGFEERLPSVAELYPELIDGTADDPDLPSCSAIESLERQHPFINQLLATHALGLLSRLFRYGRISYRGGFVSVASGRSNPMPIPPVAQIGSGHS
jgi:PRTRC genetic system ThiF family protein